MLLSSSFLKGNQKTFHPAAFFLKNPVYNPGYAAKIIRFYDFIYTKKQGSNFKKKLLPCAINDASKLHIFQLPGGCRRLWAAAGYWQICHARRASCI